jgi:hypothetical protein
MAATKDRWKRIPFTSGVAIPFQAVFSHEDADKLREGLIPEVMEDKWFIYFEDPHLFLHRSWTGQPVYRVTLAANGEESSVIEALCVAGAVEETTPEYQASLLDFLISNLLLGKTKPFPVPPGAWEARPGLLQHVAAGTGFPQSGIARRRWWRWWRPWR